MSSSHGKSCLIRAVLALPMPVTLNLHSNVTMRNNVQSALGFVLLHSIFVLSAHAQNTMFTYQGRVTAAGVGFTGSGQFKFALVTSTNLNHTATATANAPSGGYITGYAVTFGGNGYVTAPGVTVYGGGGSGAAAHANLTSGVVTSLSVDSPGNGAYTNAPTVLIAAPPPSISYTTYWSNDGTSVNGGEPATAVSVTVSNGVFTVVVGDTTQLNMASVPSSLFNQPNLQLRIWFNDGVHGSVALDPAQSLTPTPYAVYANTASNLDNGLFVQQNSSGAPNVIGGSAANFVGTGVLGATIFGGGTTNLFGNGLTNKVTANFATVSGGAANTASAAAATIGGGDNNTASGANAMVGGGYNNTASGSYATVGGGFNNIASGADATVSGGLNNAAISGNYGTVAGGAGNTASGYYATVSGGWSNTASGGYSVAAGAFAQALHQGSFVWADSTGGPFASTASDQFSVRASGGIRFAGDLQFSGGNAYHNLSLSGGNAIGYLYGSYNAFQDGIHLGYNFYADSSGAAHVSNPGGGTSRLTVSYGAVGIFVGGVDAIPNTLRLYADTTHIEVDGTFNNNSDRNAKQNFAPVSASEILDEVLCLPISEWSYKDDPTTRHVGPMAQDFHSVFRIGTDDRHIAPIDEGGLAFAAIQGLNQKVEDRSQKSEDKIQQLETQNAELLRKNDSLEQRLDALERIVQSRKSN